MNASFLSGATLAHFSIFNSAISAGKIPGVYVVPTLSVNGGAIEVGPNSGLFGCGVFYEEDTTDLLTITALQNSQSNATLGTAAAVYTIAWEIDEGLYASPSLVLLNGQLNVNYDPFHVVLGWLFYPGGNLTLSNGMLVQAPVASVPRVLQFFPGSAIYSKLQTAALATSGLQLSFANGFTSLTSSLTITQSWQIELELQSDSSPVTCVNYDVVLSSQAFVALSFVQYNVPAAAIASGTLSGPQNQITWQTPLTQSLVQPWERFSVYLTISLSPGSSAQLGSFSATNENIVAAAARS